MATASQPSRSPRGAPTRAGAPPIPAVRVYTEVLDEGSRDESVHRFAEAALNGFRVTMGDRLDSELPEDRAYLSVTMPGGEDATGHYTVSDIRDFIAVLLAAFHRAKRDNLLPGRTPVEIVR